MKQKSALTVMMALVLLLASCGTPAVPATPTSTLAPTTTATIPPTFTPTAIPMAIVNQAVECHAGPGSDYDLVTTLETGQQVEVIARNTDGTYWIIKSQSGETCWLESQLADFNTGEISLLSEITPPPLPTPAPPAAPSEVTATYLCEARYIMGKPGIDRAGGASDKNKIVGMDITVTITWTDNADNEIGYQILNGGDGYAVLPPDTTMFVDAISFSNLTVNASYRYGILAFNDAGQSKVIEVTITASCR